MSEAQDKSRCWCGLQQEAFGDTRIEVPFTLPNRILAFLCRNCISCRARSSSWVFTFSGIACTCIIMDIMTFFDSGFALPAGVHAQVIWSQKGHGLWTLCRCLSPDPILATAESLVIGPFVGIERSKLSPACLKQVAMCSVGSDCMHSKEHHFSS